jgi:hypothetical protein
MRARACQGRISVAMRMVFAWTLTRMGKLSHCAMSVPAIARAATTPLPKSGHYTAATLKT